jgi:hypothetical protein
MGSNVSRAICVGIVVVGGVWFTGCGDNVASAPAGGEPDHERPDAGAFPIGEPMLDIDAGMPSTPAQMPDAGVLPSEPEPEPEPEPVPDPVPAARCDPSKPFAAPVPLTALNTTARDIQAMSPDGIAIYFASNRAGTLDLYTTTRSADAFTTPTALAGFASSLGETSPYVTTDGLTLVYSVIPSGASVGELYIATRASTAVGWSVGTLLAGPSSASEDDGDPVLTGDGGLLYFASQRGTSYDLYVSTRGSDGKYGSAQLLTELSTADYDAHPRVTADGLTMYWSSMRTDGGAQGGADIWKATRASRAGAFGTPRRVAELNTSANESPTWVSADDCVMYLQSNRAGGAGDQDIWVATKPL